MKRSNRGESLIETLISMFIIALGMAILSSAISRSAKMNEQANSKSELSFANLDSPYTPDPSAPRSIKVEGHCGFFIDPDQNPDPLSIDVDDVVVKLYEISGDSNEKMYFYVFP